MGVIEGKPTGKKNYGSIPHMSKSKLGPGDHYINFGMERILTEKKRDRHDEIIVTEKYDGSNVGVVKIDGQIYALTRSGYKAHTSPYEQHHKFGDWVYKNLALFNELLDEGQRIVGEWLFKSHGIIYQIIGDPVIFFDFFDSDNNRFPFQKLIETKKEFGIKIPRLLHRGESISVDKLIPILNNKDVDHFSKDFPEGMVYKVERKEVFDFAAKWVRPDFDTGKYLKTDQHNIILTD